MCTIAGRRARGSCGMDSVSVALPLAALSSQCAFTDGAVRAQVLQMVASDAAPAAGIPVVMVVLLPAVPPFRNGFRAPTWISQGIEQDRVLAGPTDGFDHRRYRQVLHAALMDFRYAMKCI